MLRRERGDPEREDAAGERVLRLEGEARAPASRFRELESRDAGQGVQRQELDPGAYRGSFFNDTFGSELQKSLLHIRF